MENEQQEYVDRPGLLARARARGVPLKLTRLNKDCAAGLDPKVAAIFGRCKELYTVAEADRYINTTFRVVTHEVAEKLKSDHAARQRARFRVELLQPPPAT